MTIRKAIAIPLFGAVLALGTAACETDEGPLERAGEEMDDAAENAGDAMDDMAD